MSTDAMQWFFTMLTLAAMAGAVGLLAARLLAGRLAVAATVTQVFGDAALWVAWIVAFTATLGSLYFSEVANYTPCALCWYQRIAMYPLAVVLLVAALRNDRGYWRYGVPVAAIGAAIAVYHRYVEVADVESGACSATVPCNLVWFETLGFITLPVMALTAFVFIIVLLTLPTPSLKES